MLRQIGLKLFIGCDVVSVLVFSETETLNGAV